MCFGRFLHCTDEQIDFRYHGVVHGVVCIYNCDLQSGTGAGS